MNLAAFNSSANFGASTVGSRSVSKAWQAAAGKSLLCIQVLFSVSLLFQLQFLFSALS